MSDELRQLREVSALVERLRETPGLIDRVDDAGAALMRLVQALEDAAG
jgi:hypothetical protein